MEYMSNYASPLGGVTMASDGNALIGLWFNGQKYFPAGILAAYEEKDLAVFRETRQWLDVYFSGHAPAFTPPLLLSGTPFRKAVWEILLTIPYGQTVTYVEITRRLDQPRMSSQAVGGAVAHNPISLIVPCHRVIGANGSLTGYAGGLDRKLYLLQMEGAKAALQS